MTALTPGAARSADGTRGGWFRPPQSLASLAWVTWRQHRAAIIGLAVLYGGLAVIMVWAALQGHANYTALIRDRCIGSTQLVRCGPLLGDFPWLMNTTYPIAVAMALHIVPLLTGMFLGAPVLAREFEQGTVRFAWTQGTSRTRWAVVQLTLLAIPVTAAAAALGALAAWSVRPFGPMWGVSLWRSGQFDATAVTLAGWTLFAFSLGTTVGVALRRTVPAMAVTAASLAGLLGVTYWKLNDLLLGSRPRIGRDPAIALQAGFPVSDSGPVRILDAMLNEGAGPMNPGPAGSLLLRGWYTGPDGHRLIGASADRLLSASQHTTSAGQWSSWLTRHHYAFWVSYQPPGRYWIFQSIEGGALLVLTLLLGAATIWLVRHRRA